MRMIEKVQQAQKSLQQQGLDGWLFYDFCRSNDLACNFLEIPPDKILTRRFFYWVPASGEPVKIASAIEIDSLGHLPGKILPYRTWQELESALGTFLTAGKKIAMEYSPRNAVPYVSKVDAGTMEVVRGFNVEVVSSADLLQKYTSVWDAQKLDSHLAAAAVLCETVDRAWLFIAQSLRESKKLTEYDVQQFILENFQKHHCLAEAAPIVAVNEHSANPHYTPTKDHFAEIRSGDFILIDLWCKQDSPRAVYADITRVGVASNKPSARQDEIFNIVKRARDAGSALVVSHLREGKPLLGWEVDQACRDVIQKAGYGEYFIHRTGHNIDESDHGNGAHIDNYETQDRRQLLRGTCFSIEPGIYLPGEFGVRLEYDVIIRHDGLVQITGGIQEEIVCLL